ncbi:MAG: hypothetical protein ACAI44_39795 [Candidatus Sericytochromatia bacterium]
MAKVAKEMEYTASEDFEVLLELSFEEFKEKSALVAEGVSNGLPEAKVLSRTFEITDDCECYVDGMTVPLKAKQKLKDAGLAFKAIDQGLPGLVKDKLRVAKDTLIDEDLALGFIEAEKPVLAREKKAPPATGG